MKKLFIVCLSLLVVLCLMNLSYAVEKKDAAKKESPGKATKTTGVVTKVDAQNCSINIKSGDREMTFQATAEQCKQVAVDQKVMINYEKSADGKLVVKDIKEAPAKKGAGAKKGKKAK